MPETRAGAWWSAVRRSGDVPRPLAGLLNGRTRVEVSPVEARALLAGAARLDGWADADPKPLLLHRGAPDG